MRGKHRADEGVREEALHFRPRDSRLAHAIERQHHRAFARCRPGDGMGAGAADVMLVLGDIGEMREIAECADDQRRLIARQAFQDRIEPGAGSRVLAMKADRSLADGLDQIEDRFALLRTDGVAEDAAEETNVLAQRRFLVGWVVQFGGKNLRRLHDAARFRKLAATCANPVLRSSCQALPLGGRKLAGERRGHRGLHPGVVSARMRLRTCLFWAPVARCSARAGHAHPRRALRQRAPDRRRT